MFRNLKKVNLGYNRDAKHSLCFELEREHNEKARERARAHGNLDKNDVILNHFFTKIMSARQKKSAVSFCLYSKLTNDFPSVILRLQLDLGVA